MSDKATLLIVDDIKENIDMLKECLKSEYHIIAATSGEKALKIAKIRQPDLVLLDIMMPEMDGYETCRHLKSINEIKDVPVIFVSAKSDASSENKGLELGAVDYIYKPAPPEIVRRRVALHLQQHNSQKILREEIRLKHSQVEQSRQQIIRKLCQAAEFRDNETALHVVRMSHYSYVLAKSMGLNESEAELIHQASPMHDIGKIGIPDAILLKQGKLSDSEFSIMKQHPQMGAKILEGEDYPLANTARDIALYHHEKWNGSGYPHGLKGDEIPLSARIVAVADVFDALTSSRPYKEAWSIASAIEFIDTQRGEHFDPDVVDAFHAGFEEILKLKTRYADGHGQTPIISKHQRNQLFL